MNPVAARWLGVVALTALATTLLVALSPDRPPERVPWFLQPAAGAVAGLVLFLLIARRRPSVLAAGGRAPALAARLGLLGLLAADEEIVWRRVLLGLLLFGGAAAALLASSLAFALAHRSRPGLHLLTGATFGGVYLATGALSACVTAHWGYNLLVGALAPRLSGPGGQPP